MRISTLICLLVFFSVISLLTSCSIMYSTGKSSDSISASSDSISASSGDDDDTATATASIYAEDIAAATVHYVFNQNKSNQFQQIISSIARSHGIVDWEQEKVTFVAMGKGLKQAGIDEQAIVLLTYFNTLAGSADYSWVLWGHKQS